jgi:hypothetical protein
MHRSSPTLRSATARHHARASALDSVPSDALAAASPTRRWAPIRRTRRRPPTPTAAARTSAACTTRARLSPTAAETRQPVEPSARVDDGARRGRAQGGRPRNTGGISREESAGGGPVPPVGRRVAIVQRAARRTRRTTSTCSGPTGGRPHVCDGLTCAGRLAGMDCRPSCGPCDVRGVCSRAAPERPAGTFAAVGAPCTEGRCDGAGACANSCTPGATCGTGNSCGLGRVERASGSPVCVAAGAASAGTVCRSSEGPCDVAEVWTGVGAACPADGFSLAGLVCRPSSAPCDPAENCKGPSASCPAGVPSCRGQRPDAARRGPAAANPRARVPARVGGARARPQAGCTAPWSSQCAPCGWCRCPATR